MFSDELDESAGAEGVCVELCVSFFDFPEALIGFGADGCDEDSGVVELIEERAGDLGDAGGEDDAVKGAVFGPSGAAVADAEVDIVISQSGQDGLGGFGEFVDSLDGADVSGQGGQEGGLVAASGADFEDGFVACEGEGLGHEGDDVGLTDGLAHADGEGVVGVGLVGVGRRDEGFAREAGDGVQAARVGDVAGAQMALNHRFAVGGHFFGFIETYHAAIICKNGA